jgi:hypothetical protein
MPLYLWFYGECFGKLFPEFSEVFSKRKDLFWFSYMQTSVSACICLLIGPSPAPGHPFPNLLCPSVIGPRPNITEGRGSARLGPLHHPRPRPKGPCSLSAFPAPSWSAARAVPRRRLESGDNPALPAFQLLKYLVWRFWRFLHHAH